MALVYPSDVSCRNLSERAALDDLRAQLDDSFRIYANVDFLTGGGDHEGEVDFLILHPELGLLVLEVKGHGVERGTDGAWTRMAGGERVPCKDPFLQASGHARALSREIGRRLGRLGVSVRDRSEPLPWEHAVYFPLSERPEGHRPLTLADGHLLTRRDRPVLGERVRALMAANVQRRGRTVPASLVDHVHTKVLMPLFRLAPSLGAVMDREAEQTVRLDERQLLVLDSLAENDRFAVVGGAGTGKTILALETARRFAEGGAQRVLYTCFNRMLAEHAARAFASTPAVAERVVAVAFHELCRQAARETGQELAFTEAITLARREGAEAERAFWDHRAVEFLFEGLAGERFPRFDALVLDEAQDMRPHWWPELEALGARGRATPMVVFFDPDQAIFGHEANVPPDLFRFRLVENHRNPRALADWIADLTEQPLRPHPAAPMGAEPVLHPWIDRPSVLRTLNEAIAELRAEGVSSERIALLAPHTLGNPESTLHGVDQVAGLLLTTNPDAGPGHLLYATITRFKGLERDIVFLLDIDPSDPLCARRHRYVGASRARLRLQVFCRGAFRA